MTGLDLNGFLSGAAGASILAGIVFIVKLMFDRLVPTRTDKRGDVAQAFDVLKEISSILRAEKKEDAERLQVKQARIDVLELESEKDYNLIRELRTEITELQKRLATKELHIQQLTEQIERLGARVIAGDEDLVKEKP